jgi:uncharacterized protein (UPF0335 family)
MAKSNFAKDQLKSIAERIARIEDEQATLAADKREIYLEAKGNGFDAKFLRKAVALAKKDRAELSTEHEMVDLYYTAITGVDLFG